MNEPGETMTILIDPRSGRPIYEQIVGQLRKQILNGTLPADAPLPSIRALAKDLAISVITTKRAYEELEAAGLIYTQPGRGSFVSGGGHDALRGQRMEELEAALRKARALAADCGLTEEDVWALYRRLEEEET